MPRRTRRGARRDGGGPPTPGGVGDQLVVYIDFSDPNGLYQDLGVNPITADGQAIAFAGNKVAPQFPLFQTTAANRPTWQTNEINGLAVAQFDSTDTLSRTLNFVTGTDMTIFGVAKPTVAGEWLILGQRNSGGPGIDGQLVCFTDAAVPKFTADHRNDANQLQRTSDTASSLDTWRIAIARWSGTSQWLYVGGVPVGGSPETNFGGATTTNETTMGAVGVGSPAGQIGTAGIYNKTLSVSEMNQLGTFLAAKYNLSWTTIV